jgi:5-(carboxyamino)imidazole ribonucleotide mutase
VSHTKAKTQGKRPLVGIIMGSQSDWATMEHSAAVLKSFGVAHEMAIASAHRTPRRLYDYASAAAERGLQVIIAGAGGAAHLPGMAAAMTTLPVFGVPVRSKSLDGLDSLLSIAQMPAGIPVGTLAIGEAGAKNAAFLAVAVLALQDKKLAKKLAKWRKAQTASVAARPKKKSGKK